MSTPATEGRDAVAVTVVGGPDDDGCWRVVDTHGRALRLPRDVVDPRLLTLHPGQRLRVRRAPDGKVGWAGL